MRSSLHLLTIANIPIKVHWTFSFLVLWVAYICYSQGYSMTEALWVGTFVVAVMACVIMHEYGHALTARRYGIPTHDILILPIGGLARLEYLPEDPNAELVISIAGPLVNVILSLGLVGLFFIVPGTDIGHSLGADLAFTFPEFVLTLAILNIFLFLFNLIPAFPMDGGRILRSILSKRMGRKRATFWATRIAQLIAVGFVVAAVFYSHLTIGLIGGFVFLMARVEEVNVSREEADAQIVSVWDKESE